jgi:hypothetical protein
LALAFRRLDEMEKRWWKCGGIDFPSLSTVAVGNSFELLGMLF